MASIMSSSSSDSKNSIRSDKTPLLLDCSATVGVAGGDVLRVIAAEAKAVAQLALVVLPGLQDATVVAVTCRGPATGERHAELQAAGAPSDKGGVVEGSLGIVLRVADKGLTTGRGREVGTLVDDVAGDAGMIADAGEENALALDGDEDCEPQSRVKSTASLPLRWLRGNLVLSQLVPRLPHDPAELNQAGQAPALGGDAVPLTSSLLRRPARVAEALLVQDNSRRVADAALLQEAPETGPESAGGAGSAFAFALPRAREP